MTVDGLRVEKITVCFGGQTALDGVSLDVPLGRITGLIGPNGAGKTTLFNVCSGFLRPDAGRVFMFGEDITHAPAWIRARRGLGRTFQKMELCNDSTVRQNIALGLEARLAGANVLKQTFGRGREKEQISRDVDEALHLCGIEVIAGVVAGALSTGQRRMVELARAAAANTPLLLLDEPSSGLDPAETEEFARILARITARREVGVLLVEHDMELVMGTCAYIYVLDFGELIFHGVPEQVRNSKVVRAAYLGDEACLHGVGQSDLDEAVTSGHAVH